MDQIPKIVKRQRTTSEQLEIFLNFCDKNPNLLTGTFDPKFPNLINELWGNLSDALNAVPGPTRTPKQWKESLMHWKNQIKSRARKCNAAIKLTGGGPPDKDIPNEFEQRALQVFGQITVDGNEHVSILGFGPTISNCMCESGISTSSDKNSILQNETATVSSAIEKIFTVSPTIEVSTDTQMSVLQEQGTQTETVIHDIFRKSNSQKDNTTQVYNFIKRSAIANEKVANELKVLNGNLQKFSENMEKFFFNK